ncbi:ABC transporter substrate-binding protein [Palleronia abyssalis]|uniref:Leu/Ile/Val-binding protein n=1 Tax=Palleronia abyssalis TaxID=1501240 RepID=A0A2R8BVD0_9RHOB|nr:ABC transporter substrate-binding protein [Palleronia abyssalis]SPJ24119.1 Leu/Ile/Val-binding protein [Palleronia abyssalis]
MNITRRAGMAALAGATALTMVGAPLAAQDDSIVVGGSLPLTGVFAFAGIAIEKGMSDYFEIANEEGGIDGRQIEFVYEDTGYEVNQSVAVFNQLTSQNDIDMYYGDSTGFAKTIAPELQRRGDMIMGGASFASELNDPEEFPYIFIPGPDYIQQVGILLEYIADENPGASIALVNSDTEFGRDPIETTKERASELGLEVVEEIITPPGAADVSTEVLRLRRSRPDYIIFHGYVLSPIPEFVSQIRELGLDTQFMGTFWSMDSSLWQSVGEAADGFLGVMPYRYYYDEEEAPMLDRIREMRPEYQATGYMQGFFSAMLMTEAARRAVANGAELNGDTLKSALSSIEEFDTGGIIGVPVSVKGNAVPFGRVYEFNAESGQMEPVSDWIELED